MKNQLVMSGGGSLAKQLKSEFFKFRFFCILNRRTLW